MTTSWGVIKREVVKQVKSRIDNQTWDGEGSVNSIVSDLLPKESDTLLLLLLRRPAILRRDVAGWAKYSNIGFAIRCGIEAEIKTLVKRIAKRLLQKQALSPKEKDDGQLQ